jgi:hypothetical protein
LFKDDTLHGEGVGKLNGKLEKLIHEEGEEISRTEM